MRSRLYLMGLAGLMLVAAGGDALSRQPVPGAAAQPQRARQVPTVFQTDPRTGDRRPVDGASAPIGRIDWQAAVVATRRTNGNGQVEAQAGKLDRAAIDETALPILLPNDPALLGSARIYSFGDFYTISADLPGVSVSLSGNARPMPVGAVLTVSPETQDNLVIQRTVEGQAASFTRFGALYTVEVSCAELKDARCTNKDFVRQLYQKTNGVVLGAAARKAAGLGG